MNQDVRLFFKSKKLLTNFNGSIFSILVELYFIMTGQLQTLTNQAMSKCCRVYLYLLLSQVGTGH